jgi:hypothetical protein
VARCGTHPEMGELLCPVLAHQSSANWLARSSLALIGLLIARQPE